MERPMQYTEQQIAAIENRNHRLIVSAAAGSGKTAVLVRRVIELICDPENPCDIGELVVVTFTNAAASEMRSRVADALHKELLRQPDNERLRRQLARLPAARIQTVHAFCQNLIRQNFAHCGVSADFRLLDEDEALRLRDEVLAQVLEEAYARQTPAFRALSKALRENRGDNRLVAAVTGVYQKLLSFPDPRGWLDRVVAQSAAHRPQDATWGRYILELAHSQLQQAARSVQEAAEVAQSDEVLREKCARDLEACQQCCRELEQAFEADNWDHIRTLSELKDLPRKPLCKGADEAKKEEYGLLRDDFKKRIKSIGDKYMVASAATIDREQQEMQLPIRGLCDLVSRLMESMRAEKRRRNQLDFSDLEHLAYGLLTQPGTGEPSQLAQELSSQIRELLVDEYQDTNSLQDAIFEKLIPQKGGAFFVGDLKQSIYRFRMAEPQIFLRRYKESAPCTPDAEEKNLRLALNRNFRSYPQVLDLCNFLFSRLMTERFGGIDYDWNEELHYDEAAPRPAACCEAWLIDGQPDENGEEEISADNPEAALVAARISQMLAETSVRGADGLQRPARPEDFAILLSSYTNKAPAYRRALEQLHIPVAAGVRDDFWQTPEILTMLSFLRVIDNRRQDVSLVGVMRSPIYLFTADELGRVRLLGGRWGDYFDALTKAAPQMPRVQALLEDLDHYADLAVDMTVSQLIQQIYEDKNVMAVFAAMPNGEQRRENLEAFARLALRYEKTAARGLYAFLGYLDRLILRNTQMEGGAAGEGVQIMSIHKSKGLEFPIVFVPDLSKPFNMEDVRKPVLVHDRLGIGMNLRVPELHAEMHTQAHAAMGRIISEELRAEELRKLYVAMTRAKERLVLTAGVPNAAARLKSLAERFGRQGFDPLKVSEQENMASWVFGVLLGHPGGQPFRDICQRTVRVQKGRAEDLVCHVTAENALPKPVDYAVTAVKAARCEEPERAGELLARMEQRYAHEAATLLPSKLTPTGVRKMVPDTGELFSDGDQNGIRLYHAADKQKKAGAADIGKANHLVLSCMDLAAAATPEGVERELARLRDSGMIPENVMKLVDPQMIARFTTGPLGARTVAARRFLREYEFGVLVSPDQLIRGAPSDEKVLINGVIDLLLFEEDGMTVLDFKTDRVRPGMAQEGARRHALQLNIYALAAREVFGLPVKEKIVFFLRTGEWARV